MNRVFSTFSFLLTLVVAGCCVNRAAAQNQPSQHIQVHKRISIDELVKNFNELASSHQIGKTQPALTVAEFEAAVRKRLILGRMNEERTESLRNILETKSLEAGSPDKYLPGTALYFSAWHNHNGYRFENWTINFMIKNVQVPVRSRFISVRPMTEAEKKELVDAIERATRNPFDR